MSLIFAGTALALSGAAVATYDVLQRKHAILHNFPIIGHLRYILETVGPELRQYIVTNNDEERPFSRDQRRWVYATAKQQNKMFGFGTDNDLEGSSNYLIIQHSAFPFRDTIDRGSTGYAVPCAKILGGPRGRRHAFRPGSIINTSAMSYGSLSGAAVEAINRGVKQAGALQNTGEGGIASHHDHGGDLIWQIGTGYFGCRNPDGTFNLEMLKERAARYNVRALEIKLSQGAKPGKGGVLPGPKVTPEIAAIRGVEVGKTVYSPSSHSAFHDVDSLLAFIELLADETGLPVGIKSAVGEASFWTTLAERMAATGTGPDHIQIDGGEGGTGAAPLAFSDHVSLPFKMGFTRVYRTFAEAGLTDDIVWIGSGRLGFPVQTLFAMSLGCDMVAVGREAMLAIGCIQAQKCHTGSCPTGIATHRPWQVKGLDPTHKSVRLGNYLAGLRQDVLDLAHAAGQPHPALVPLHRIEILGDGFGSTPAPEVFGYQEGWGLPNAQIMQEITRLMAQGEATSSH